MFTGVLLPEGLEQPTFSAAPSPEARLDSSLGPCELWISNCFPSEVVKSRVSSFAMPPMSGASASPSPAAGGKGRPPSNSVMKTPIGGEDVCALVVQVGASSLRVGYAQEDHPRIEAAALVGRRQLRLQPQKQGGATFCGTCCCCESHLAVSAPPDVAGASAAPSGKSSRGEEPQQRFHPPQKQWQRSSGVSPSVFYGRGPFVWAPEGRRCCKCSCCHDDILFPVNLGVPVPHTEVSSILSIPASALAAPAENGAEDGKQQPSPEKKQRQGWELDREAFSAAVRVCIEGRVSEEEVQRRTPTVSPPSLRRAFAAAVFEDLQAPAAFFASAAAAAAFAMGRSSALVVELGAPGGSVAAVSDGYTLRRNAKAFLVGGNFMDRQIELVLLQQREELRQQRRQQDGSAPQQEAELLLPLFSCASSSSSACSASLLQRSSQELSRHLREAQCVVRNFAESACALSPATGGAKTKSSAEPPPTPVPPFELPDGTPIDCSGLKETIGELLFNPTTALEALQQMQPPSLRTDPTQLLQGFTGLPNVSTRDMTLQFAVWGTSQSLIRP
ncbi:actin-like family protein [Cyclospora cayetanensis]|uniref:Actin-like family protein n=1 Tax=Cyclospora cayetanensis TaxID=88456 RepID=A0A1D3CU38_9EIME|nr:actin-like family protein [Cyclospora cayetanensis]